MSNTLCSVPKCNNKLLARGLCSMHYARWRRTGSTHTDNPNPHGTPAERLWRHVDKNGPLGCWLWTGSINGHNGYGGLKMRDGTVILVHRLSYELLVGPIPKGLEIDHLCRVRNCVNPAHLEPVTKTENWRRGISIFAINARKTHCKSGHEFTTENTYIMADGGRSCRICMRRYQSEYQERKRLRT